MPRHRTAVASLAGTLLTACALQGCGSLPAHRPPQDEAMAVDVSATGFARIARASLVAGARSGFRLLPQGAQAWDAREQLIARAEKTLDVQYYFIADDGTGHAFLAALEAAAARGVRVRLLVDDLHTAAIEPALARMARLPGVEVRLFNPFCCARATVATRFAASLADFHRVERRMHNKLLVADGSLAIAGGRNIGDEYFARGGGHEFIDIDALLAGDIVAQLASVFDRYWRSDAVWPARGILEASREVPRVRDGLTPPEVSVPDGKGRASLATELATGRLRLVPGNAYAFADSPSKVLGDDPDYLQETSVTARAREALLTARSDVVVVTPYLIPRARGMALIADLHRRGVRLRVLTNGAASNDSRLAHAAYAHYRRRLLEQGVELHEIDAVRGAGAVPPGLLARAGVSRGRLHAKAFVIDGQTVFLGSMNFDPRSADKNTELGILVESAALAREMTAAIAAYREQGSLRVSLDAATAQLHWTANAEAGTSRLWDAEPGFDLLDWLTEFVALPLIPEALL